MNASETITDTSPYEVEIAFSEDVILKKLTSYQLNPKQVCAQLKINHITLNQAKLLAQMDENASLEQLYAALSGWQPSRDLSILTAKINQLIFTWLHVPPDEASTQSVLNFLRCFELKSVFGSAHSSKFHCFLFDLFTSTTQKYQQLQLDYLINFDTNTQLPNTNQILQHLTNTFEATNDSQLIGLFAIEFQLSKNNPVFSHITAQSLSKQISALILENIPTNTQLYYSDNLQFDILIPELTSDIQANLLAAKLQRAFEQMLFVDNQSVLVTPFIGCAYRPKTDTNANSLYSSAKLALESALSKHQFFVVYTDALQVQLTQQNDLENKVLEAFASDSLTLFFQPLVNLKDSSCVGAELLLRWSEKAGYSVYPSLTVEILNKVGKGKLFTRWLINSACRYAAELKYEHKLKLYLTINLRAEDLYDVELPHLLLQALALWKIAPKDLVLEITEDGILEHNETTNSVISELARNGFRLALDDFGTGFSSLSRLRTMPIDLIKIDQSFIRDITNSKDDQEIVKSIAMLANSLGKEVLAEGVEDKACLDLIKKMKIHKCQGYYFAKPMPFEKFIDWAKAH